MIPEQCATPYRVKHFGVPVCQTCKKKMIFVWATLEELGFNQRTFKCLTCSYTKTDKIKAKLKVCGSLDPARSKSQSEPTTGAATGAVRGAAFMPPKWMQRICDAFLHAASIKIRPLVSASHPIGESRSFSQTRHPRRSFRVWGYMGLHARTHEPQQSQWFP